MGIWYAEKCEPVVKGSVINLSSDCIQFIETGNEKYNIQCVFTAFHSFSGKPPRKTVLKKNFPLEEEEYFTRMKTIDDIHSHNSGVNFENFKKMANSLEATIQSNKSVPCAKRRVYSYY